MRVVRTKRCVKADYRNSSQEYLQLFMDSLHLQLLLLSYNDIFPSIKIFNALSAGIVVGVMILPMIVSLV